MAHMPKGMMRPIKPYSCLRLKTPILKIHRLFQTKYDLTQKNRKLEHNISLIIISFMPKQMMVPFEDSLQATESIGDAKGSILGLNC